jgi:hypothetical protein
LIRSLNYLIILSVIPASVYLWWTTPCYVQSAVAGVAPSEIKKAMQNMGPGYDYKMIEERLYVNRGDGKWLRLRYERR